MAESLVALPLRLRSGLILPNRIAKSAMSEAMGTAAGDPTPELAHLYARLARGGAGLLVTGNVMVDRAGRGEAGNVVVSAASDREAWRRWAASVGTTPALVQLNHAGRQVPRLLNPEPVGPSAVPVAISGAFATPRALHDEEIEVIVRQFGEAASVVAASGFAGVQVHAAHGYLASQFLSPRSNQRTDRWGGSLENRMRFLVEVVRAVRGGVGAGRAVSVKLNSADFLRGGFDEDDSMVVARTLAEEGVDLLEVSGGTYERPQMMLAPSSEAREAHFMEYARRLRPSLDCPVMLTGGLRTPAVMEQVLREGVADVVGLARPIAVDPDFPARVLAGNAAAPVVPTSSGPLSVAGDTLVHQSRLQALGRGEPPSSPPAWWLLARSGWQMWSARARS